MTPAPNPFSSKPGPLRTVERGLFWVFRCATYAVLLCGLLIFGDILVKGTGTLTSAFKTTDTFPYFTNTFLMEAPETLHVFELNGEKHEMGDREFREFTTSRAATDPSSPPLTTETYVYSAGGIWPCIVGTLLLTVGSMTIALILGVCSAIYLSEYARDGRFVRFIRLAILNLAGVPSIVFGLFGFGLFVIFFGWNVSLLAGWFTLAFMVLPVVITASEEALKAVPRGFREGALALGATKWQAIRTNVLPYALPGILTSSILGIARVAGETAPIMFTAAYVVRDKLPWDVEKIGDFFYQGVMALPYHIYVVSSKIPQNDHTQRVQYGTALVFLLLVALIATTSIVLRNKLRRRYQW
ncbi:phosphate ABC transporter permease PstA [Geminisphaera colitermitum]|uniref:phosphate ABC transporter permease PstA n=1 Tax=Geminisphaera colitermitum TaxID=1148786 RepID=UPI000158CDFA|nr:phosphate ABC transporter permease PstA [Geminisphaera colitermitum]